ncbi:alpha/beta hydrolase [Actinocorallia sp. API 0066]|uniref:alpha/beta hydrolase n=1 Tax=Actinocorallia sp. API 0066 TaxID=2896846 RepID=UPI001E4CDB11|nr:alpha/beta hydrolase [Actinocorallia sp. API 0066]MCD0449304.1 alpha/beta hydrolase [Actinocorallia sp. API 0066]
MTQNKPPAATWPLVVGTAGSAAVALAYRPLLRRFPWSVTNMSAFLAAEAPPLVAGLHALAAGAALRPGRRRPLALALNLAALAGLAGLSGDARRSARALATALDQAGVTPPPEPRRRRPPGVPHGPVARWRYRRAADVVYADHGRFGTLDVWHRADLPRDGKAPVLIQIHGGAWQLGDKVGQGEPLMGYLAEQGWVCVTVNHRLAPAARWPAMIVDVKRAIAWTRRHIAEYGGDPGFIAITGGSSGAHLAALAALTPNDPDYQPGFADADTSLAAAVPRYGLFDLTQDRQGLRELLEGRIFDTAYATHTEQWRRASPIHRVGPHAPPFLVVHGSRDAIVGAEQSRSFVDALRAASSAPVGYAELPRAQHGFDTVASARTAHTVVAIHRFLAATHANATRNRRKSSRRRATTRTGGR